MRDKRPVDELSIEELERILAIKKREARQQRLEKMQRSGRVIEPPAPAARPVEATTQPPLVIQAGSANVSRPPAPAATDLPPLYANGDGQKPAAAPAPRLYFEDGDEAGAIEVYAIAERGRRRKRRLYDRLLLLIEVAAVIAIVVIGVNLFNAIRTLERETAAAQALVEEQRRAGIPTLAPTPSLRLENYVLPGGHVFTADGSVQFNYDEVPSHLLPLVESQWVQPVFSRPPVTSETALSIIIPKLNLNQAIVQGVDWEALKQGVGQLPNDVNPGDARGNLVLAAHNDIYGELFRHLDQLEPGDQFEIQTQSRSYTYVVTEILIVEPNDVWVMDDRGRATATLISCYPYQVNNRRIVVMADRVM